MEIDKLRRRLETLEERVSELERELEVQWAREGIRRGRDEANRGEGMPAIELVQRLRQLRQPVQE